MANAVAVLMVQTDLPIMMQCAEATSIPKGTCLKLTDPFTVIASSAGDDEFGGIAAEEKIGGDGKTMIAVYRRGIFKVEAGTSGVTVAYPVKLEAANEFTNTGADESDTGYVWGRALETATNGETFLMELGSS